MPKGQFGFDFRDAEYAFKIVSAKGKEYNLYGLQETLDKIDCPLPNNVHLMSIPESFLHGAESDRVFLAERRLKNFEPDTRFRHKAFI